MTTIWAVMLTVIFIVLFWIVIVLLPPVKLRRSRRSIREYRAEEHFRSLRHAETAAVFNKEIKELHSDLQKWRHEYKNNLIVLSGYINNGNTAEALAYIEAITAMPAISKPLISTNNAVLDAVINTKLWYAKNQGIDVYAQSICSEGEIIQIASNDLCSIVGNLLDNAIEACDRMTRGEHKRFMTVKLVFENDNLFITIENSHTGRLSRCGEVFISSKKAPYNGIGLKHVDTIIKKYEGHMMCKYNGGVFSAQVMLPTKTQ
jgi:sensor histidine kinase regulating citrate/malate metabolism